MTTKKTIAKKTVILGVLNTIRKYATKEHPVSQTAITDFLRECGIECDRKTVGRNIEYLILFGYPIVKVHGKGCYLDEDMIQKTKNPLIV